MTTTRTATAAPRAAGGLRSGEVAELAGVNPQTLRYYERRGLLPAPDRSPGGHRLYPQDAITVLRVVKAAQRLGFTLTEVADLLDVGKHRHDRPQPGLRAQARAKLEEVEARMADLSIVADTLRTALDSGCDDLLACAGSPCCPIPFSELATHPHHAGHDTPGAAGTLTLGPA